MRTLPATGHLNGSLRWGALPAAAGGRMDEGERPAADPQSSFWQGREQGGKKRGTNQRRPE